MDHHRFELTVVVDLPDASYPELNEVAQALMDAVPDGVEARWAATEVT